MDCDVEEKTTMMSLLDFDMEDRDVLLCRRERLLVECLCVMNSLLNTFTQRSMRLTISGGEVTRPNDAEFAGRRRLLWSERWRERGILI